jgi:hypothetical protein
MCCWVQTNRPGRKGFGASLWRRRWRISLLTASIASVAVTAPPAHAVVVTNFTTDTTVFRDDFESGLAASPGTATAGPDVFVTMSTTPPDPGPFQGSSYLSLFRNSDLNGQGNFFAGFTPQTTVGDVVQLRSMVYLPNDGAEARIQMILDDGNFNSARAHIFSSGTGHVMAAVGPAFTPVDTGLTYTPGAWQQWGLDYAIGAGTFSVTVNGATASGFASHSVGQISLAEIFNGNNTPGTFYVDAVPEPAAAATCLVGLAAWGWGPRRTTTRKWGRR